MRFGLNSGRTVSAIVLLSVCWVGVCTGRSEAQGNQQGEGNKKPTPMIIDNETLKKYSDQGNVTSVKGSQSTPPSSGSAGALSKGEDPKLAEKRRYWRTQYEKQLKLVQTLESQIEILNREIPGLWRDFYAWDDPMYRDGVIKPKLDEALGRWERMTEKVEKERAKLPKIREDARRDGAQPGWFRGMDKPKAQDSDEADTGDESILPTDFDVEVVTTDGPDR